MLCPTHEIPDTLDGESPTPHRREWDSRRARREPCDGLESPSLQPPHVVRWRREWDSNPRYGFPYGGFQDRCHQPLGHPSAEEISIAQRRPAIERGLQRAGRPGGSSRGRRFRTDARGLAGAAGDDPRAPAGHRVEQRAELEAERRERILDLRRHLRIDLPRRVRRRVRAGAAAGRASCASHVSGRGAARCSVWCRSAAPAPR